MANRRAGGGGGGCCSSSQCFSTASITGLHHSSVGECHSTVSSLWAPLKPTPPSVCLSHLHMQTQAQTVLGGEPGVRGGLFRRQEGAGGSEALPAPHLLSATASRGCHFRASHPPRRPAIHLCLSQDEFLPLELVDDRQPLLRGSPLAARSLPLPANAGILATRGTSFQASAAGRVRQQPTHPASLTICHSSAAVCQSPGACPSGLSSVGHTSRPAQRRAWARDALAHATTQSACWPQPRSPRGRTFCLCH